MPGARSIDLTLGSYKRMSLIKHLLRLSLLATLLMTGAAHAENPRVLVETSHGKMEIELFQDKAPKTVANFLNYVDNGFYAGTIFHRVIPGFMVQGGGFTEDFQRKPTEAPVQNEANNGLANERGTLAMARTSDPHSATSQFFINSVNNTFLNYTAPNARGWGYKVFGNVVDGMATVDHISALPTGAAGPFGRDVPRETVLIKKIVRN